MTRWMLAALLTGAWMQDRDDELVKRLYPQAASVDVKTSELSEKSREKIAKAIQEELKETKIAYTAFEAELYLPRHDTFKMRTTTLTIQGSRGPIRLAVTIIPDENVIAGVHLVDQNEGIDSEKSPFLAQFFPFAYSPDALARPISDLEARLKKAGEAKDDEGKTLKALVAIKRAMKIVSAHYGEVSEAIEKKNAKGADAARAMAGAYDDILAVADLLKFLGDGGAKFKSLAEDAKTQSNSAARSLADNQFDAARKTFEDLSRNTCGSCHGSYQDALRGKRDEMGMGDGYLRLGFDATRDPSLDEKLQVELLRVIRKSALILKECK